MVNIAKISVGSYVANGWEQLWSPNPQRCLTQPLWL